MRLDTMRVSKYELEGWRSHSENEGGNRSTVEGVMSEGVSRHQHPWAALAK